MFRSVSKNRTLYFDHSTYACTYACMYICMVWAYHNIVLALKSALMCMKNILIAAMSLFSYLNTRVCNACLSCPR